MSRRVVITGIGAISPVGNTVDEFWESISNGKHGIAPITRFPTDKFKVKLAAEVRNFDAEQYLPKKEIRRLDLFSQYAIAASAQAVEMSGLKDTINGNDRAGVIIGSGIGGLPIIQEQVTKMNEKGPDRVNSLFITTVISNMAAGNVAIKLGAKGICSTVVTACATGNHCIGEAFRNIKHDYSDIIIAGGTEGSITEIGIAGFAALTALTETEDADRASIPFDEERQGFVMGEGAGILVLEELEHAKSRGAKIYAEIVGYGANCDSYHITSPNPTGEGAARAMELAMKEGNVEKQDVTYINAHGTSTPANDLPETKAIKTVFGELAYNIPVSSTKSMTGHLLGAAGAIEAIACIKALLCDFAPPTVGLKVPDEGCDLNYVPNKGIKKAMKYALSNSFGFGGHNAVICLKKWEE